MEEQLPLEKWNFTGTFFQIKVSKLWVLCGSKIRPSYFFRYLCRLIIEEIVYFQECRNRQHGGVTSENIVYRETFRRPIIQNPTDENPNGENKDFDDLAKILMTKLPSGTSFDNAEIEFHSFICTLKDPNMTTSMKRNHYFVMGADDRRVFNQGLFERTLHNKTPNYVDRHTFICDLRNSIPEIKVVLDRAKDNETNPLSLKDNVKCLRNFFYHGRDRHSNLGDVELEEVLYKFEPTYWEKLYIKLDAINMLEDCFPVQYVQIQENN